MTGGRPGLGADLPPIITAAFLRKRVKGMERTVGARAGSVRVGALQLFVHSLSLDVHPP